MLVDMIQEWKMVVYPLAVIILYLLLLRYLDKQSVDNQPLSDAEYISQAALIKGTSEYDIFFECAKEWHISNRKVENDFKEYLLRGHMPYYVKDFVRKTRKDTEEKKSAEN
ncbi:MAG: hypothetical protein GY795_34300 [Desulfobacterales bacterium]|nr:hypothetical protein [Desulfobacterales bacterium]